MSVNLRWCPWAPLACLAFWQSFSLAQSSDVVQNLAATARLAGRLAIARKLSPSQTAEVDASNRERNVSNCRKRLRISAIISKLTQPQARLR